MRKTKRMLCILLSLCMIFTMFPGFTGTAKADDEGGLFSCSEEEAYEKGQDYYMVWYIGNKGNAAKLMWGSANNLPGTSIIERTGRSSDWLSEITEWRLLTFDLQDVLDHGALEEAYCEACLYDLVCGQETAWSDGAVLSGDFDKAVENVSLEAWSDIVSEFSENYNMTLTQLSKRSDLTVEQLEGLTKIMDSGLDYDKLAKTFKFTSKVGSAIDTYDTIGQAVEGLARIQVMLEQSSNKCEILKGMTENTDNSAYQEALNNYSEYISGSISDDDASSIYLGTLMKQNVGWKIKDAVWDCVSSKIGVLKGVVIAEATAKASGALANALTGNEDRYSAYEKMEVSHDIERTLWKYIDNLSYTVDEGSVEAAEQWLTAYDMLESMYGICYDDTESYYEACCKEGALNMIFPGINQEKYDNAMEGIASCRSAITTMFADDRYKAEKAYAAAKQKYDPEEEVTEVTVSEPDNVEEQEANFDTYSEQFRLYVDEERRLTKDMVIYGNVYLDQADFDLNGHKLTVYGDVILNSWHESNARYNTVNINGTLEAYGDAYSEEECTLSITGASSFIVHGNMNMTSSDITISGGRLQVDGDMTMSYDSKSRYQDPSRNLTLTGGAKVTVAGDYTSQGEFYLTGSNSALNIGGSYLAEENSSPSESLKINLIGSKEVMIRNLTGGELNVGNSGSRNIIMSGSVRPAYINIDSSTVKVGVDENLILGGVLNTDLTIDGDACLYNDLDLHGHVLIIAGDAWHGACYSRGQVKINEGTLYVMGDYSIADLADGNYTWTNTTGLNMSNPEDRVIVDGNLLFYTSLSSCNTLTDGILEVKGNITQKGEDCGFRASGNHTTYLNGSKLQKINLEDPDCHFNTLVMYQYEENYIFNPDNCWNTRVSYCEHVNRTVKDVKAASCLEDGYTGDTYCLDCGECLEKGSVIEATGHKVETIPNVKATCEEAGHTGGRRCTVCGIVTKAPTVLPPLSHQKKNVEAVEATCTTPGKTAGSVCSLCGTVLEGCEEIPVIDHTVKNVLKAASLTANGYTQKICSVCGKELSSKTTIYRAKKLTLSKNSYVYSGSVQKPTVTVMDAKGKTISSGNYNVRYQSGCKTPGKYTVTVTLKGKYTGTLTGSFTILPKGTALASLAAASKSFTAKWTKQASQTTGYQLQYATSGSFSGAKSVLITANTTVSKKVTGLTAKKKYYVRIRTYKTVSGTKYYSSWSKAKTVTVK